MSDWTFWLENRRREERIKQIKDIWDNTLKSLGIGGLSDEDAAHQSLSRLQTDGRGKSHFSGKQAALKRLSNGQVFNSIEKLRDPELMQAMQQTKQWLGDSNDDSPHAGSNGDTTVGTLLKKMFGPYFQQLIDADMPDLEDDAVAEVEPQPPVDNMGPTGPNPGEAPDPTQDVAPAGPQQPGTMQPGQQPQIPQQAPPQPMDMNLAAHTERKGKGIFEAWMKKQR